MRYLLLFLLFAFLIPENNYAQGERILNFHTDIEVNLDRSVLVTETIEVYAAGNQIKRGITRNLPARRHLLMVSMKMKYDFLEVTKNGEAEPYFIERNNGDQILYIGRKEEFLSPGIYKYKIRYSVPNQIAFLDEYDEIYWNAIGTDVQFPIEKASCQVRLPKGVPVYQESAYVGYVGEKGTEYNMTQEEGVVNYEVTRSLKPKEGFTVAVGFEKGHLKPPGFFQRFGTLLIILSGLLFLIPYYIQTWWKYGQDPPTPASYPLWNAPDDLSSASINYIQKGRNSTAGFTSSVIDLAIKGYLKIEEVSSDGFFTSKKNFELIKLKDSNGTLPKEEQQLFSNLFSSSSRVLIDGTYDSGMEHTFQMHKSSLEAQHRAFIREGHNSRLLWLPILITIAVGVIAGLILTRSPYAEGVSMVALMIFAPVALAIFFLYVYLIKKPTVEKLDLRARIKGFKMYLQMAEADRLNLLNPPEMTPQHFESVLPFAFALGVAHQWTKKFEKILEQAQYRPDWHNSASPIYFSNHFGKDFSSTVSGATTQPSSSGGSGGGGFSGGGGGGGGVGGW